jgi:hypothetical protein
MNRTRFSEFRGPNLGMGMHPGELWGTAARNPGPRARSARVRARRALRRAARRAGVPFKAFVRGQS